MQQCVYVVDFIKCNLMANVNYVILIKMATTCAVVSKDKYSYNIIDK